MELEVYEWLLYLESMQYILKLTKFLIVPNCMGFCHGHMSIKTETDSFGVLRSAVGLTHVLRWGLVMGCHLTKSMDRVETPFGFQPIIWTFVRHTVSRCLIFPLLPEVARVTWSKLTNHRLPPVPYLRVNMGYALAIVFSGPLPLRSYYNSPPGVCFRESLVLIDYTQKLTRSTLALKLSVAPTYLPMGDCHTVTA